MCLAKCFESHRWRGPAKSHITHVRFRLALLGSALHLETGGEKFWGGPCCRSPLYPALWKGVGSHHAGLGAGTLVVLLEGAQGHLSALPPPWWQQPREVHAVPAMSWGMRCTWGRIPQCSPSLQLLFAADSDDTGREQSLDQHNCLCSTRE